jgi:flavodoxin
MSFYHAIEMMNKGYDADEHVSMIQFYGIIGVRINSFLINMRGTSTMKRTLSILLSALLIVTVFSACGIKEKLEQEAGEAIGEKILEGIGDDDVDIDINESGVVIEGTDGESFKFGSSEWPDSELAKLLPPYESGEINGVVEASGFIQIVIEDSDQDYFGHYLEDIKNKFKNDAFESKSSDSITYTGSDSKENVVSIFYDGSECVISIQKAAD